MRRTRPPDASELRRQMVDVVLAGCDPADELGHFQRENKRLRVERDILSRAAAWFAREIGAVPSGVFESMPGEPGGNRTHDPKIKSLVLYRLSYRLS